MATPVLIPALLSGELSPSLFGRVDIDRERIACSTLRNAWGSYKGGVSSRAGTKFVGFSKQTGRDFPPRLIPFQFSIDEGLALEFGNHYMRPISNGSFVTENPVGIGGVTRAVPAVITFGAQGAASATPNNAAVTFTYAPGDLVTLAGGVTLSPAVLEVVSSQLKSIVPNARGTGYAVADTITLAGGTAAPAAVVTVATVVSVSATGNFAFAFNPSDGDTLTLDGTTWTFKTVTSTATETAISPTLAGTLAQLVSDLNASADVNVSTATYSTDGVSLFITFDVPGAGGNAYTLVSSGAFAVRSGATLTGGSATGVGTVTVTTPGIFTAVPADGDMTESATSGGGSGASFQTAVFAPHALSVSNPGAYTTVPANPVAQASTDGIGLGATFTVVWAATAPFANDDWVFIQGVGGMTELNGNSYRLSGVTSTHANLLDAYGNPIDSTGFTPYTGGGTAARIYTVTTPYAETDLAWLKFTQSADVMTLCCVNQSAQIEYAPADLSRFSDTNWVFSSVVPAPTAPPPTLTAATISDAGGATNYAYQVTAVANDGSESIASNTGTAVGVSLFDTSKFAQGNIRWSVVANVGQYNIYRAQLSDQSPVPAGSLFGLIGSAYGNQFTDKNLAPDFGTTPPRHQDPFARGQIIYIDVISGGSGYSQTTVGATMTSGTGSGALLEPVVQLGAVVAILVMDRGQGYQSGDVVTITGGAGAAAQANIGPETGTYPSVPGYFQQRRVFADSLNLRDTYWMSQPGAYLNFDTRLPTIDTDAITGSPWAVQVDGIQALLQTAAGLLVMTGQSAWMLVGQGSFANNVQAISPASQVANPLPFTGCSATVPPQKVLFDVLYITAKGDFVYQLPYQGYAFTEPIDLTQYATHLFVGYRVNEWAWCEQPYKLDWVVRNDGTLLSLSYLKAQEVMGWGRHDTQGSFRSTCAVTEPPVDAPYFAVERTIAGQRCYMIERMDNRIWPTVEDAWCVDSALALNQPTPPGTLTVDTPFGAGSISGVTVDDGGSGYSLSTTAQVIDQALDENNDPIGSGAVLSVTVVAGVITAIAVTSAGANYRDPKVTILDPNAEGGGGPDPGIATAVLNNLATFNSSSPAFSLGDTGKVIRAGGGVATVVTYVNSGEVLAQITTPISAVEPDLEDELHAVPQATGDWTMTMPTRSVGGLLHLAGARVTGLADGVVISPRVVSDDGTVTLDRPASAVVIGLGFQVQVQTVPIDVGSPTIQGQRKNVAAVSAFVQDSRSVRIGQNQQDGSTLSPPRRVTTWKGMQLQDDLLPAPYNSDTVPLFTGWVRGPVPGGWGKPGQVAVQQNDPLPLNILSLAPELVLGDSPSQAVPKNGGGKQQQASA